MDPSDMIQIVKESFETWYNKTFKTNISIAINYSDEQKLSIKAFHTIRIEVVALGIKEGLSYVIPLIQLQENYNHGITTEQEAKEGLIKKLLVEMYAFKR